MRRVRVIGSVVGCLAVASACATTTGGSTSAFSAQQRTRLTPEQQAAWTDSVYAQAIADAEGPRASISALVSGFAGSRRVRASFRLESDAYVLIGHIDADGVLRVVFPVDPSDDDGYVRGGKTYETQEFFAGFTDQYRFRAAEYSLRTGALPRYDAYDGGLGYLFMIATWRPMRFDRFSAEGRWDSFELADHNLLNDPKPAIEELASLLAGENREAYTVKLARFLGTRQLYGSDGLTYATFNYCMGYQPFGFVFNPFRGGSLYDMLFATMYSGTTFTRRGVTYYYSRGGDCYIPSSALTYYGMPYRTAYHPFGTVPPNDPRRPRRAFDPGEHHTPFTPRIENRPRGVPVTHASDVGSGGRLPVSPEYRQRGLITSSDEPVGTGRRQPRVASNGAGEPRTRPSIQDMVDRRPYSTRGEDGASNNGFARRAVPASERPDPWANERRRPSSDWSGATARGSRGNGSDARASDRRGGESFGRESRVRESNAGSSGGAERITPRSVEPPARSEPPRRFEPPARSEPRRFEPPARSEPPRSEPPARSAPPASSQGSSSGSSAIVPSTSSGSGTP